MNTTLPLPVREHPVLQAPGAGLPPAESWFLNKAAVPIASRFFSRTSARRMFIREGERILYILEDANEYRLNEPVLVKRPMGIEDNSRAWSLSEVAEHVMIVGNGIRNLIKQLSVGRSPGTKFKIAQVKPHGGLGVESKTLLRKYIDQFTKELDEVRFPKNPTYAHPWFGNLNATQWYQYAAWHHYMHRIQAERIEFGLLNQI